MRDQTDEHEFTLTDSPWHLDTGFDSAVRGYQRSQVRRYTERVETAMTEMAARQTAAQQRISDLTAQVVRLQADLMARHREQAPTELPPARQLGARLERMLALAEEEAREMREAAERVRAEADQAAAQTCADAHQEASRALAEAREEAEQTREQAHRDAHEIRTDARKDAEHTLAEAQRRAEALNRDADTRASEAIQRARRRVEALHERYDAMQHEIQSILETVDHLDTDSTNAAPSAGPPLAKPRRPRDDRKHHSDTSSRSATTAT